MYSMCNGFKVKTKHLKGYVKKDYQTLEFEAMLNQIDCWFITGDERSDRLREVTVAKLPLTMNGTTHYLSVKYTKPMYLGVKIHPGKFLRYIVRLSKAEQSWRIAHMLLKNSIPVPAPVAFFNQRFLGILWKCYYIAEYLKNAQNLNDYLIELTRNLLAEPDNHSLNLTKKKVIEETGALIGKLHCNGYRHGDLGIGNLMISWNDSILRLYLVDIETIIHYNHLTEKEVAYDLACLYHSVRNILTGVELRWLLRAYFHANPSWIAHKKRLLREIRKQYIPIFQKYNRSEERKAQHLERLRHGQRVLFIDLLKEERMAEIIKDLKNSFPMSEFTLLIITENTLFYQACHLYSYLKEIRQGNYEIVIDWRGTLFTAILTCLSGATLRMGYRSRNVIKNRVFYNFLVRVHSWSTDRRIRLLAPLKALGITL